MTKNNKIKLSELPDEIRFQASLLNEYGTWHSMQTNVYITKKQLYIKGEKVGEPKTVYYSLYRLTTNSLVSAYNEREKTLNHICCMCPMVHPHYEATTEDGHILASSNKINVKCANFYCSNLSLQEPVDYTKRLVCKNMSDKPYYHYYFETFEIDIKEIKHLREKIHEEEEEQ